MHNAGARNTVDPAASQGPAYEKEAFTWLGLRVPWVSQTSYRSTESGQILLNRYSYLPSLLLRSQPHFRNATALQTSMHMLAQN